MAEARKLLRNSLAFGAGTLTARLVQLALLRIYTRNLSTEQFGLVELVSGAVELLVPILTLCSGDAALRLALDRDSDKRAVFSCGVVFILAGAVLVWLFTPLYPPIMGEKVAEYFAALYLGSASWQFLVMFSRGAGRVAQGVMSGVLNAFSLLGFGYLFLVQYEMGVPGYLLSVISGNFVAIVFLMATGRLATFLDLSRVSRRIATDMLGLGMPLVPGLIAWWVINMSGRYMILSFSGLGAVGIYSAAAKIPAVVNLVSTVFQQAWQISSVSAFSDDHRTRFYSDVFEVFSVAALVCGSALICGLPWLSRLLLAGDFAGAWQYSPLLILAAIALGFSAFFGTIFFAAKKNLVTMRTTVAGAVLNLLLCWLLIPRFGIVGAGFANFISCLSIVVYRAIELRDLVKLELSASRLCCGVALLILQAGGVTAWGVQFEWQSALVFVAVLGLYLPVIRRRAGSWRGEVPEGI